MRYLFPFLLLVSGCITSHHMGVTWSHPTKDATERGRDQLFCEQRADMDYASIDANIDYRAFRLASMDACMQRKGYTREQD